MGVAGGTVDLERIVSRSRLPTSVLGSPRFSVQGAVASLVWIAQCCTVAVDGLVLQTTKLEINR